MSSSVVMRNSKARTFLYVLLGCCMMFVVFMLSSTHSKLKESQESNDKCQQQRDSLSAQLQVVYEHKSRLEKTLQVEVADRKRAEDGVKLVRDQSEKDRADAQDKIKSLQQQLSESQVAQAEEFKNLKASYGALDQEKEKINSELASHVALLQQEREAKLKLERQLEELQQSRRSDGQVAVMLQKQLETCRAESSYLKLQQQNLVVPLQHIASVGNEKPGASADLLAGNEGKLQPGAQAEPKTNAKEERGAGKMGSRYQGAGAESRQPKQLGGIRTGSSDAGMGVAGARYPVAAHQSLKAPGDLEPQPAGKTASPYPNGSALGQPMEASKVGAAPPLRHDAGVGANRSEQELVQGQGAEAGDNASRLVPSQPGAAAKRALQPAAQPVKPSKGPSSAVKPEKQLARPAQPLPSGADAGGPEAVMQAPQAAGGKLEGGGLQGAEPVLIQHAGGMRTSAAAGAAEPLQGQLRQPRVQPAEQPPVQQPQEMPALNQIPPVLPAPNLAAAKKEPVVGEGKNEGNALDVLDSPMDDLARLKEAPVKGAAAAAQGKAGSAKKGANADAALQDENEVDGVANLDKPLVKGGGGGVNYGKDLIAGAGRAGEGGNRLVQPKLGRPNQPQHAEPENEDDLEYANPAKDDDAAEDQDDDGPFGPGGGRGKAMQDAADFDDQGADIDQQQQQQQQQQQFNNPPEPGIAVHPK